MIWWPYRTNDRPHYRENRFRIAVLTLMSVVVSAFWFRFGGRHICRFRWGLFGNRKETAEIRLLRRAMYVPLCYWDVSAMFLCYPCRILISRIQKRNAWRWKFTYRPHWLNINLQYIARSLWPTKWLNRSLARGWYGIYMREFRNKCFSIIDSKCQSTNWIISNGVLKTPITNSFAYIPFGERNLSFQSNVYIKSIYLYSWTFKKNETIL